MKIEDLLALATQATSIATTVANIIVEAKEALSEDDQEVLKGKLAELRAANDAAYARVQDKLAAAASQPS